MSYTIPKLSTDLAALSLDHLADTLTALKTAAVDELYCFLSDGVAAPLAGGGPVLIQAAARLSDIPIHAHIASEQPGRIVSALAAAGCKSLTVQIENCPHPHRVLGQIRDAGMIPGMAIYPGTPLTRLDYLLSLTERIVLFGQEPGASGPIRNAFYDRIRILKENIRYREHRIDLVAVGGLDAVAMGRAARLGADYVVVDLEEILRPQEGGLASSIALLRDALAVSEKMA